MATNWPVLARALAQWGCDSVLSCVGVIGTIAQEAASFAPVEEAYWLSPAARERFYADTSQHAAYQGGTQFHGRGLVQTTHVGNYQRVQQVLAGMGIDVDLVNHPELLLDIAYAAPAFAIYWTDHGLPAISERQQWAAVRAGVFGGPDPVGTAKVQRAANILIPLARARGLLG